MSAIVFGAVLFALVSFDPRVKAQVTDTLRTTSASIWSHRAGEVGGTLWRAARDKSMDGAPRARIRDRRRGADALHVEDLVPQPLVLAIEPDLRQAAIVKRIVREKVLADVAVVDSRDAAMDAMRTTIPDVLLLSALMSPRDEDELIAHLRTLEHADHLQTHTIPQLASTLNPIESRGPRGLLSAFRRKKEPEVAPSGCDPDLFAEEIRVFLQRAADKKRERRDRPARRAARRHGLARGAYAEARRARSRQDAAAEPEPSALVLVVVAVRVETVRSSSRCSIRTPSRPCPTPPPRGSCTDRASRASPNRTRESRVADVAPRPRAGIPTLETSPRRFASEEPARFEDPVRSKPRRFEARRFEPAPVRRRRAVAAPSPGHDPEPVYVPAPVYAAEPVYAPAPIAVATEAVAAAPVEDAIRIEAPATRASKTGTQDWGSAISDWR